MILWDGKPVAQRPEIAYDPGTGRSTATWDAPADLPNGRYLLALSGSDDASNQIRPAASQVLTIDQTTVTSFKKVLGIPTIPPALALVAIALVAAALSTRRRDRA